MGSNCQVIGINLNSNSTNLAQSTARRVWPWPAINTYKQQACHMCTPSKFIQVSIAGCSGILQVYHTLVSFLSL